VELGKLFLRLGCIGFGGPLAAVGLIQREVVDQRRWLSAERFLEGFTLSQLLPGPTSTQVAIYVGYRLHRLRGALITGGAFILPAFVLLTVLTWAYFRFGAIPAVQGLFYGMTPAVLAMILLSGYSLTKTAAKDWPLQMIVAAGAVAVGFLAFNVLLLFALAGALTLLLYRAPRKPTASLHLWAMPPLPLLAQLAWYFLKVGSLIFGGGLVIVPMLEQQVVNQFGWLTHREFLDGLALGQITPGPVVITATFIGYKVAGFAGAAVATVAIFLPSFVFVFLGATFLIQFEHSSSLQAAFKGINAAAVGAILGSCVPLSRGALAGIFPPVWFAVALIAMIRFRLSFLKVLAIGAFLGLAARWAGIG
jgi:chromate transporter